MHCTVLALIRDVHGQVNDIKDSEARALPNERRWDPWFDNQDQLFEHTIISIDPPAGQAGAAYIRTTAIPSQYGTGSSIHDLLIWNMN